MYDPLARATDPTYLRYQYGDSEKLRIRIETHEQYSERPNDWHDWLVERLALEPGMRVLDVGCGPGAYFGRLAHAGVRVVAFDHSPGMVAEARQRAERERLDADLFQADAQAIPLADRAFDRVMANHMLYHVPDQLAALREMRRVVKPGGRVVLATMTDDQNKRLMDIHDEVARALGVQPTRGAGARFTLEHVDLVAAVFPNARVDVRRDAFVFPDAEPAIRYYASGLVNAVDGPIDNRDLIEGVRRRIDAILAAEGVFRVPKDAGAFVVDL